MDQSAKTEEKLELMNYIWSKSCVEKPDRIQLKSANE